MFDYVSAVVGGGWWGAATPTLERGIWISRMRDQWMWTEAVCVYRWIDEAGRMMTTGWEESVVQNINSVATVISPYQRTTEVTNNIFQYCFCCFYMSPEPSRMNPFPKENFVIQNRGRMRFGCAIFNFSSAETKLWMTWHEKVKFELLSVTSIQRSKISGAFNKRDPPNTICRCTIMKIWRLYGCLRCHYLSLKWQLPRLFRVAG